jgi:homocysteine S-methyltransferase
MPLGCDRAGRCRGRPGLLPDVNCARPSHTERALARAGAWTARILGTRANASEASHAELDQAIKLDDGDPAEFATAKNRLSGQLPHLALLGGCCGTDARHLSALMHIDLPKTNPGDRT